MAGVDPFLIVCRCFAVVTAVAAALCVAANVLYAVRSFMNESDIFDGIFRCFAVLFAIFVVIAETEWEVVMKFWKACYIKHGKVVYFLVIYVLTTLAGVIDYVTCFAAGVLGEQGYTADLFTYASYIVLLLQLSVAVMTRAYPENADDQSLLLLLQNIASYMLLACGGLYIIAGILCIGRVKQHYKKKEVSREQAVKDLQELEQRRAELEALLLVKERARDHQDGLDP